MVIFRDTVQCFGRNKSSQKRRYKQLCYRIYYTGYTVFTPRASAVGKIRLFCRKNSFWFLENRFLERKRCIFGSWTWYAKLLQIILLTSFISIKTLSPQIWKNSARSKFVSLFNFGGSRRRTMQNKKFIIEI